MITGLFDLHNNGMVHCDIKPDNIIVCKDLISNPQFKIIDYGSIRKRDTKAEVYCTLTYCPPEALVDGKVYISPMIDAFSVGATIFYAIYRGYLYDWTVYNTKHKIKQFYDRYGRNRMPCCSLI